MDVSPPSRPRFERIAVCSVLGNPRDPKVWSAAPYSLANALERVGIGVERFDGSLPRPQVGLLALRYALDGYGIPPSSEAVLRTPAARRSSVRRVLRLAREAGIGDILHTGMLDVPVGPTDGSFRHYLYCDDDWSWSLTNRPDAMRYRRAGAETFALQDRLAMANIEHVFTFSQHLRAHMLSHYGLAPDRVTAVGCGMGSIVPYDGPKDYGNGRILFVAKHFFVEKGGTLLLDAFHLARQSMPGLQLTIVGDSRSRRFAEGRDGVEVLDHLSWDELQSLYRRASLLAQPMLNDPWGQVYVEALASRTPVLGLNRNGLPEIVQQGRHGFLVDAPEPNDIADALLSAMANPARLAAMGRSGQLHVVGQYSWDLVARRIASVDPALPQTYACTPNRAVSANR